MARQLEEVEAEILLMVVVVVVAAAADADAVSVRHRLVHRIKNPRGSRIIQADSRFEPEWKSQRQVWDSKWKC